MKEKKAHAFSIRLPANLMTQITAIAESTNRDRTAVITEAVAFYLAQNTTTSTPGIYHDDRLDRVVSLLEDISRKLSDKTPHNEIHKSYDTVTQKPLPDAPTPAATRRAPRQSRDPRFVIVDSEADALIVRMSGEHATLSDIASALNALGFVCATGQEWTSSRVRDYRHKLRDKGLIGE